MGTSLLALVGFAAFVIDYGQIAAVRRSLQNAADAGAFAGADELCLGGDVAAVGKTVAELNHPGHGDIVHLADDDVQTGHWNATTGFTPGGTPENAVRVKTSRTGANANPVPLALAPVIGFSEADVHAEATVIAACGSSGGGVRFLIDDETIDSDEPDVEAIASCSGTSATSSEDVITDKDGDFFIDIYQHMDECPGNFGGFTMEVPTGQGSSLGSNDPGLMQVIGAGFPFDGQSECPFTMLNFLNYAKDGKWPYDNEESWRGDELGSDPDDCLDPLLGVQPVWNDSDYDDFVGPDVLISPVYGSDISNLWPGDPGVEAKGERRGLLAFKILSHRPCGAPFSCSSDSLPILTIEIVNPASVTLPGGTTGGGGSGYTISTTMVG